MTEPTARQLQYSVKRDTGAPATLFFKDEDGVGVDVATFENWDNAIPELTWWADRIVLACNSYDSDQALIRELVGACEGAIRIEKLWRPMGVYGVGDWTEAKAVEAMYQTIKAVLAKAKEAGKG